MKLRQEYFAVPALAFVIILNAGAICTLLSCLGCGAAGRRVDKAYQLASETYHVTQQAFVAYGLPESRILPPMPPKAMDPGIAIGSYGGYLLGLSEVVERAEDVSGARQIEKTIHAKELVIAGRFDERNYLLKQMMEQARADLAKAQAALPAAQAKLQILTDADARIVSANIAVNALAQEGK